MKRILTVLLLVFAIVLSSFSVTACDNTSTGIGNGTHDGEQNNSGDNLDDDSGNNIDGSNGSGNTDSGDDSGNTDDNNSGNTNGGDDSGNSDETHTHKDENEDNECDVCFESLLVIIDFYVVNDLHGKFCDTDTQPGVDELGTYFKTRNEEDDNVVIFSSGDMWQGTAESNLTGGLLITEWMNEMNFVSMTLGNHEYDWGEDAIRENLKVAEFPFLAINIYEVATGELADYCTPSVMIERNGIQIGIIGAIGDCYSSISADMVADVEFKVGSELTALVKAESEKLRKAGADLIVYSLHDGYGRSSSSTSAITESKLSSYYDLSLSNGYVDLCFESHTHQSYVYYDPYTVHHVQGGGENSGISHVEMSINSVTGKKILNEAEVVSNSIYSQNEDDPATEALEDKYSETIEKAYEVLGTVSSTQSSGTVADIVAELYLKAGIEKWENDYDIILGGGYIKTRSPYDLAAGEVQYADILSLLPFDNRLVLCSILGSDLSSKFVNTTNSNYHNYYSEYGNGVKNNIISSATYYVIVDTYTAFYAYNNLTIVDYYDDGVYARDLFSAEIKSGRFHESHEGYTLTSISDIIEIGKALAAGEQTSNKYYVKGTVKSNPNATYGNLYLVDESGEEIYVYGLYDQLGNRYDSMTTKPMAGDTVIVYAPLLNYQGTKLELKDAVLIEII